MVLLAGCAPKAKFAAPNRICTGKDSAVESLDSLNSRVQSIIAIKAHGHCLLRYQVDDKEKKENFPVKIWAEPPAEFYMQGDVAFDARGVIIGSNEREFWVSIKPKEISGYWWGRWADSDRTEGLLISPKMLLEVLGIAAFDGEQSYRNWALSNEGVFDVLTKRDGSGKLLRKVYIYACDYSVRKIEYFDMNEEVAAVVRLGRFKPVAEGFAAPTLINIISGKDAEDLVKVSFKLSSIVPAEFSEKQKQLLFSRPEPRRFKNVYRIIDGKAIEQQ